MKIIIFGDGKWATNSLTELICKGHEVTGVVLRNKPTDKGLQEKAAEFGIKTYQFGDVNNVESLEMISRLDPALNISIAYDQIFSHSFLSIASLGNINMHAGKLPFYRGRNVINWAIINGEKEIGVTAHHIDTGIDTGDIVKQIVLPITWTDTYGSVLEKIQRSMPELVVEVVSGLESGTITREPQGPLLGTYMPGRMNGDEWINWAETSLNVYNKVRAISEPGPGALASFKGRKIKIWKSEYDPDWPTYMAIAGAVVGINTGHWVSVKTGDSILKVREIQYDDGPRMAPDWRLGMRLDVNA